MSQLVIFSWQFEYGVTLVTTVPKMHALRLRGFVQQRGFHTNFAELMIAGH